MPLSDTAVRNAKPEAKPYKLSDEKGLFLLVAAKGSKWWRLKYRIEGKEKQLSLGTYPDVGLKEARDRRDEARKLIADGIDPSAQRQAQKQSKVALATNSFELVAREFLVKKAGEWAGSHSRNIIGRLENDVFPYIGKLPVGEITSPLVLSVLRRIEERGKLETAHRAKANIGQVMRYAIATGRAERDPCPDLKGALASPNKKHMAALLELREVGGLLRAIEGYEGSLIVRCALRLAPLLFVRPGELRAAEWADIDLDKGEWSYTVSKTKTPHQVPLSAQALQILREVQPLTGHGRYVFPGMRDHQRPMSDAAINAALRRMGYDTKTEITGHGFRAMARTILAEELHHKPEVIEHQLAHKVPDALGTAYNRTKFLKERRQMMQEWADYLDKLRAGADVIPLRESAA